ncbi:nicotinate-nucleotide adenylyltransferase [Aerolutibacter daejeonensis]|uniref:nicotinate-nucleotide adenylyltransferase n=1 Tax=Aerolutibacter daejeonensis TaxID=346181 RepID=UPI00069133E7|nr:nicotinate-nucleotide adenylyltransferase [Lysobacter daejeonensis]
MDDLLVLYGGTFDPIHNGHLAIARLVRDTVQADVHLMPSADPPHRTRPGASAAQRARMLDLAVAGEGGLHVDRRELQRESRSYTFETLTALRDGEGVRGPVALVIGADSFLGLPTWHEWQALFSLCHFIVAERPGHDLELPWPAPLVPVVEGRLTNDPQSLRETPAGRVLRLRHPLRQESATAIRAAIARGDDTWWGWVPPAVATYIQRNALYRDDDGVDRVGAPASL